MEVIYGINSIRDLLRRQGDDCKKIIVATGRGGYSVKEIIEAARVHKIPVEFAHRKDVDKLAGTTENQGVMALCKPFVYADLDALISNRNKSFRTDMILVLDSVMDPQNLGSIIRSAHCLGANGVIIPEDRAAGITAAVNKASAGSVRQIPISRVTNLAQTLDYLKDQGFWVFGADAHGGKILKEADFKSSVVLVLGGESKGIRTLVKKKCDFLITVPLAGDFDSLNVSVAAGIILYEIMNQRP
jgi:23S rRNA (guanosine2251-2'-O)-methyltransferase